ncbi:virulence-associated e family protein [Flavobacteriaceae bacterium AU392]|nr:virulence-associated e family protein [Flavobacteriaceae bacterium]RKM86937.1 virulence-associated e family protein [Flavobacteriaceae bacterium AU392]
MFHLINNNPKSILGQIFITMEKNSKNQKNDSSLSKKNNSKETPRLPMEMYLKNKYDFRYNVYSNGVEFKLKSQKSFKEMTDFDLNSLVRELKVNKYKTGRGSLDDKFKSDFSKLYNPLKDYVKTLPEWDGKTDYISELASKIKTDDDKFFADAFKRWFVAMVGSGINDLTFNHTMIIFSGNQGIGKSTFIRNLLPPQLRNYSYSGNINPHSRDTLVYLSECLIIDLDELSNLTRKQNNDVKELITKSKIKLRRAFGRMHENLVRRASFIGSLNDEKFLTDLTGNRRFLCFKVDKIDYESQIDYKGIYSQAYALYKSKFKFYFDKDEIQEINARNERFRTISPLEELITSKFIPAKDRYSAELYLNASELLASLNEEHGIQVNNTNQIQLGKVLRMLGYSVVKKKGISKYAIDTIKCDPDVNELNLKRVS